MKIVGCDFHPAWQQVAVLDDETAEIDELKLSHEDGAAERFYRTLNAPALVGVEASGVDQWFLDLLQRLGREVWLGNFGSEIRASYVRKQKTDKRDAGHILRTCILIAGLISTSPFHSLLTCATASTYVTYASC